MSENKAANRKLVLLLIIVVSIIILIVCALRLSLYSLDAYEDSLDNAKLKKMVGESSVTLTQDFENRDIEDVPVHGVNGVILLLSRSDRPGVYQFL